MKEAKKLCMRKREANFTLFLLVLAVIHSHFAAIFPILEGLDMGEKLPTVIEILV